MKIDRRKFLGGCASTVILRAVPALAEEKLVTDLEYADIYMPCRVCYPFLNGKMVVHALAADAREGWVFTSFNPNTLKLEIDEKSNSIVYRRYYGKVQIFWPTDELKKEFEEKYDRLSREYLRVNPVRVPTTFEDNQLIPILEPPKAR